MDTNKYHTQFGPQTISRESKDIMAKPLNETFPAP